MNSREELQSPEDTGHSGSGKGSTRRRFLQIAVGVLAAANGLILGIPFLKTLFTPPKVAHSPFSKAVNLAGLPTGRPVEVGFSVQVNDAFHHSKDLHKAWVIKHANGTVTVFSPVCPHLGCYYNWNPKAGEFQCPCHGSIFSETGKVLGGPAPRPLDTLPHKTQKNILYISWVNYKPGIAKKVAV